jgi:hypothetical protein
MGLVDKDSDNPGEAQSSLHQKWPLLGNALSKLTKKRNNNKQRRISDDLRSKSSEKKPEKARELKESDFAPEIWNAKNRRPGSGKKRRKGRKKGWQTTFQEKGYQTVETVESNEARTKGNGVGSENPASRAISWLF